MTLKAPDDLFSEMASQYKQYRPDYPAELFQYLAMLCNERQLAWDAATGSGQAALQLSNTFEKVYASDISEQQLQSANRKRNIQYFVGRVENTLIPDESLDLITVAQALHWFEVDSFFEQVKRILKPGGVLAVWSYKLLKINPQIDEMVDNLYNTVLANYWSERRKLIESDYKTIEFPYQKVSTPTFFMEVTWSFEHFFGYLNTWSAVSKYKKAEGINPVNRFKQPIEFAWCDTHHLKKIRWPINLIVCRKPQ